MEARIVCINKSQGNHYNPHEAVEYYGWEDQNGNRGRGARQQMVDWAKQAGNYAYVIDRNNNKVYCYVNRNVNGTEFLQTYRDRVWTDNLLELDECMV